MQYHATSHATSLDEKCGETSTVSGRRDGRQRLKDDFGKGSTFTTVPGYDAKIMTFDILVKPIKETSNRNQSMFQPTFS